MAVKYLETKVDAVKVTEAPRYGIAADGYTAKSGAPTSRLIRLAGEKRWRRLMVWQFSNAGTLFVRVGGVPLVVSECDLPNAS
jgi:hypothetical protein